MLALADRWHCPPSVVLEQPGYVIRMLEMERLEKARRAREEGESEWPT